MIVAMVLTREEDEALLSPASYHANGYPWELFARLRRADPVHRVAESSVGSFWAVSRYRDIQAIEADTETFKSTSMLTMGARGGEGLRMIVSMNPPEHTAHRAIANPWFMPRSIDWVRSFAEEIVGEVLDRAMDRNGEAIDFQEEVANFVPTAVISAYLGAPREAWGRIVDCTNRIINANDPAVARQEGAIAAVMQATGEVYQIHAATFADRKANPREDFMTALIQAEVDGAPLSDTDLFSWALILTTAGHETTQSTFSMGVRTLLGHPDQLARLKADPALLPRAIEEMLRYVSPAIHFTRRAGRDVDLHGKQVRAGDYLAMLYPSANRDGDVFGNPDAFDIARTPNRHIAFGTGAHLCIGQHLARLELKVMFEQFLARVDGIELVGEPENVFSNATGGYKHMPVRMQIRPKA